MLRNGFNDRPVPAEVFHELRGHFHRVPFNAGNAGDLSLINPGKEMVKAVAELMEERLHFVMRHRGGLAGRGFREVADLIGNRCIELALVEAAGSVAIHPGAAPFRGTGIEVKVELGDQFAVLIFNPEELHIRIPDACVILADMNAVERFDKMEESLEDRVLREVVLHFLVREGVARLTEFFRSEADIPGLKRFDAEFLRGKFPQLLHILQRVGAALLIQITQESDHLFGGLSHLRRERIFSVVTETEERRELLSELKRFTDHRRVIELIGAEFGSAGRERPVGFLTQRAVFRVLEHGDVRGELERDPIAFLAGLFCGFAEKQTGVLGDALQAGIIREIERPGVRRVEEVFGELLREGGKPLADRLHFLALRLRELRAGKAEVPQLIIDDFLADRCQGLKPGGVMHRLVLSVQALILRESDPELRDLREHLVKDAAERLAVIHGHQVAHGTPGAG